MESGGKRGLAGSVWGVLVTSMGDDILRVCRSMDVEVVDEDGRKGGK